MQVIEKTAPEIGISPPVRPGFFAVAWSMVLGYFAAILFLIPLALLAEWAGIDVWNGAQTNEHGLFYRFDVWSYAAEAFAGVFVAAMTAYWVRQVLLERTDWEVPFGFAFVTIFLTGYAPAAALTPLYGATGLLSLIVAALILRWRIEPAGAEPMTVLGVVPKRYRGVAKISLIVAVPVMAFYALAYGATHPLRTSDTVNFGGNGDARGVVSTDERAQYRRDPGAVNGYRLGLQNRGPFAISDLAVVGIDGSAVFQLERVTAKTTVEPDQRVTMRLGLRQGPVCTESLAQLDAVQVRYETLGERFAARLPLADSPSIVCPGAR